MPDKNISDYIGKEITGAEFNEYFPDLTAKLIKLTNETEKYEEFEFKTGINEYEKKQEDNRIYESCGLLSDSGDIYFTHIYGVPKLIEYRGQKMKFCRYVKLPEDSKVSIEKEFFFKADKIILEERTKIKDLPFWLDEEYCLESISKSTWSMQKEEEFKMQKSVMKYIKNFSDKVILRAIETDPVAVEILLRRKVNIPEEMQIVAVKKHRLVISDLIKHIQVSEEVQLASVENYGQNIMFLYMRGIKVSEKVKIAAVKQDYMAIHYILSEYGEASEDVKKAALQKSGFDNFNNLMSHLSKIRKKNEEDTEKYIMEQLGYSKKIDK